MRPLRQGMSTRPKLSIPVAVYPATPRSASPLAARVCSAENVEVPWAEIVEGYEYDKGEFGPPSTCASRASDRVAGRRRAS